MKAVWEVKALGEVCEIYQPKTISAKEMTPDGKYVVYGANGPIGRYTEYNHAEPQLLVTCRGATCGAVNTSQPFSWITGNAMVIRPRSGDLLLKFVEYFFHGAVDLEGVITGAAQPQITRQSLAPVTIPLPPLDEQKRIVEVLDAAFEGLSRARAHTEANLQNARELFESGVDEMFQSDLVNWKSGPLGKLVGNVATGPFGSILHKSDYVEGQTPIVNPAHIVDGQIEPDSRKTISAEAIQRLKSYVLRQGDIVIGRRGDMGRCAVVGEKEDGWLCGTGSFFIRPNGNANSDFVAHLLRSRTYIEKLESVAGGATMPNISNKDLAELNVELPSLQQQNSYLLKIDALRSDTNELQSHYRTKLADLDALRQALLQKAFAGELT